MALRPAVVRRLMREMQQLKSDPPEGIRVTNSEENMLDITGIIEGPAGTPYEGGYFKVKFNFTEEFPAAPPKCRMLTKIFHPNVSSSGEICVNTLKKDWQSSYGIGHILVTVKCLLIYPNPESALDEEAGKLLLENYDTYCDRAKLITSVHATPRVRPAEFLTPTSSSSTSSSSTPSSSTPSSLTTSKDAILTSSESLVPTIAPTSLSTTTITTPSRKSTSPAPQPQPLQSFGAVSNTENSTTTLPADKQVPPPPASKPNSTNSVATPAPLGTANSNTKPVLLEKTATPTEKKGQNSAVSAKSAVKRPASGTSGSVGEKRKKALKRL